MKKFTKKDFENEFVRFLKILNNENDIFWESDEGKSFLEDLDTSTFDINKYIIILGLSNIELFTGLSIETFVKDTIDSLVNESDKILASMDAYANMNGLIKPIDGDEFVGFYFWLYQQEWFIDEGIDRDLYIKFTNHMSNEIKKNGISNLKLLEIAVNKSNDNDKNYVDINDSVNVNRNVIKYVTVNGIKDVTVNGKMDGTVNENYGNFNDVKHVNDGKNDNSHGNYLISVKWQQLIKCELHSLLNDIELKIEKKISNWKERKDLIECAAFCQLLFDMKYFVKDSSCRKSVNQFSLNKYGTDIKIQLESSKKKEREGHKVLLKKYFK